MKHSGTITRVQRGREEVTLIIQTEMGLRGVAVDHDVWNQILSDAGTQRAEALVGWSVEYNPATGDLELTEPPGYEPEDTPAAGEDSDLTAE